MSLGQNWPRPEGHKFEHSNKKGKFQNSSLELEGLELSELVYSISLWTYTKFGYMMPPPPGSKVAPH